MNNAEQSELICMQTRGKHGRVNTENAAGHLPRLIAMFWFCTHAHWPRNDTGQEVTVHVTQRIYFCDGSLVNSRVYRANLHVYISSDTEGKTFGLPAAIAILSIMVVVNRETHSNPLDGCRVKWSYQLKAIFGIFTPPSIMSLSLSPRYTMPPNCWHMDRGKPGHFPGLRASASKLLFI